MTPMETRSLSWGSVLLLALAILRFGWEARHEMPPPAPGDSSSLSTLLSESRKVRAEEERRSKPFAPGEVLDPNRSGEEDLDRLPGIGPATARAIVAYREEHGGFETTEDLLDVPGIGPATLTKMKPRLDFTQGVPLGLSRAPNASRTKPARGSGPVGSGLPEGGVARGRVDLNRGSREALESLPGIGPALAGRILESRRTEGPFRTAEDLLRIRGIGPATLARLRPLIEPGG